MYVRIRRVFFFTKEREKRVFVSLPLRRYMYKISRFISFHTYKEKKIREKKRIHFFAREWFSTLGEQHHRGRIFFFSALRGGRWRDGERSSSSSSPPRSSKRSSRRRKKKKKKTRNSCCRIFKAVRRVRTIKASRFQTTRRK